MEVSTTSLNSTRIQFGTNPYVTIDHSAGTFFGGTTPAIKWGSTIGGSRYGYIAGGALNVGGFGALNMIAMGINNSNVIFSSSGAVGFLTGSGSHITLDGDNGIVISDNGVPSSTSGRMYRSGSNLYWNGNQIQTGTGSFLPISGGTMTGHITMGNSTSTTIRGDGSFLFLMRSSATYAVRIRASGVDIYEAEFTPRYVYGADVGTASKPFSTMRALVMRASSYLSLSDENLKTDIADETKGVDFLKSLRPITYKWRETVDYQTREVRPGARTHHGFIAQEVKKVLGDDSANDGMWCTEIIPAVAGETGEDGTVVPAQPEREEQSLRYEQMVGPIVKAIQELAARVEALEG